MGFTPVNRSRCRSVTGTPPGAGLRVAPPFRGRNFRTHRALVSASNTRCAPPPAPPLAAPAAPAGCRLGRSPLPRYQEINPFESEDSRLFRLPNIIEGWGHCGVNSAHRTPSDATRIIRKSITLRCFYDFPKRGNFLITRRSGVSDEASLRCSREQSSLANPSPATKK